MYLKGTRRSLELSCSQAGVFGETDRTVAVAAHTWSWWSPSHADTECVCFCVRVCECVQCVNSCGTFASCWAQRECSAHASGQQLHEVNQRGPEVIVTTFPCQSGRYFDKKLSTLCCVRQNCTSLLKNYSIP